MTKNEFLNLKNNRKSLNLLVAELKKNYGGINQETGEIAENTEFYMFWNAMAASLRSNLEEKPAVRKLFPWSASDQLGIIERLHAMGRRKDIVIPFN